MAHPVGTKSAATTPAGRGCSDLIEYVPVEPEKVGPIRPRNLYDQAVKRVWSSFLLVNLACASEQGAPDAGQDPVDAAAREVGRFEAIADLAGGPRQEIAVVAAAGEIYAIGGYDETMQFGAVVEAYDPATNRWRRVADLPVAMHHANAAAVEDRIYVLGFLGAGFEERGRTFMFDPATNQWAELGGMPANRQRGASVTVAEGGKIYVIGGTRNRAPVGDVDEYDPKTDSFRPLPPLPRTMDHGAGGAYDGKLFVAGGRAGGIGAHTGRLDVFDLATGRWSEGPAMPTSRAGTAAAMLDGRLYVFGGEGNASNPPTRLFVDVEVYDVAGRAWRRLTPMDPPRHGMGAAALGARIYVPGGATSEAFRATAIAEVFVPPE